MNVPEISQEARKLCLAQHGTDHGPNYDQIFAQLIASKLTQSIVDVWYNQGVDLRGSGLDKFLVEFHRIAGFEYP